MKSDFPIKRVSEYPTAYYSNDEWGVAIGFLRESSVPRNLDSLN
jgi:hypothetical protein